MQESVQEFRNVVPPIDETARQRARARLDDLTKPLGSLGDLEAVIVRLAGITGQVVPVIRKPAAVIFAADHGVSAEGISAYGEEVTEEMVVNMLMGGAVSSVLARKQDIPLQVVDVGVKTRVRHPEVIERKVRLGTANLSQEPAMTRSEAVQAVQIGMEIAENLLSAGHDLLAVGEMGIGNTTACSAMLACLLGHPVAEVVGRGTGIDEQKWLHKCTVIENALRINQPDATDPWDVMTKVGGLEIAALAGAMIACGKRRVPVLLDGLITGTAALWAARLAPQLARYFLASHQSAEPAHALVLQALGLKPLAQWNLRVGEGSGGLLLLPILQQACYVMAETVTFEDARVTNPHRKSEPEVAVEDRKRTPVANDFSEAERRAVYKAIATRRDIRSFLPDEIPEEVLERIVAAAHHGPSVGYMQPWNFIFIRDPKIRAALRQEVERERVRASEHYQDLKKDYYLRLKVEGLLQAPLTICVTNHPERGGPYVLGRNTIPETDLMSTSCAIENMWLAARAEGIGIGWVSIYQKQNVREILHIPEPIEPVALLSVGYTAHFPDIPLLERVGWGERLDLSSLVYHDVWGQRRTREGETRQHG